MASLFVWATRGETSMAPLFVRGMKVLITLLHFLVGQPMYRVHCFIFGWGTRYLKIISLNSNPEGLATF
jgi:hypothetical protein